MAIEQQNGDYDLTSAISVFNKTAAADGQWELDIRVGDGAKNLHTDAATLTLAVTVDGATVNGDDASTSKKAAVLRGVLRTGPIFVASGDVIAATLLSNNANDADVDVTVTPYACIGQSADHTTSIASILEDTATTIPGLIGGIGTAGGAAISTDANDDNYDGGISGVTSATTKVGTQTNTYASTSILDGTAHIMTHSGQTVDIVYQFLCGGGSSPVSIVWTGIINPNNDTLTFQVWDHVGVAWETVALQDGQTLTTSWVTKNITLYARHIGTAAAELGKVYLRLVSSESYNHVIRTDQVYVTYAITSRTVGYADGAIWVDTVNGIAGTENFVNGTADNPVLTWADALTLATQLKMKRFHIVSGSTITLTANFDSYEVKGENWNLVLDTSYTISGTLFTGADITGLAAAGAARPHFHHCEFAAVTIPPAVIDSCGIGADGGTFTAGGAGQYVLFNCYSMVPGSGVPSLDFSGLSSATGINVRGWFGGSNYTLDGDCTISHEVVAGGGQTFTTGGANVELRGLCRSVTLVLSNAGTVQAMVNTGPIIISGTATTTVNLYGTSSSLADSSSGTTVNNNTSVNQTGDAYTDTTELLTRTPNLKIADTTGNWATAGTWENGVVPDVGENIVIRNGVTVTVAASLDLGQFGTLEVQGSGILNIASGQTVATVPVGWTINTNAGTVTTNNGTVTDNSGPSGIVTTNNGTVTTNNNTVTNNYGMVTTNNDGTVTTNYGTVTSNNNIVTTNSGGAVTYNWSTVTTNNGLVTYNYITVTTNNTLVIYNSGTVTTNNGIIQFVQTATDLAAIIAQTDQLVFVDDRVKSVSPPTSGSIGSPDVFMFSLSAAAADPLIISSSDADDGGVLVLDRIVTTHTHTSATTGTQWQLSANVISRDPAYTKLIGDPVITYSSSDEGVATVDASGAVTYVADGSCNIIGTSAAIGTSPSQRVEVAITNSSVGGQTVTEYTYVDDPGSVREDATAAIDGRIVVGGKEKAIFSTLDHATPSYVRNTDCWAADLDLTGISPWNSTGAGQRAGTLISPRHIVFANHYPIAAGATVRFVDGSNNIVTRTVTATLRIGSTDLMVGVLDADATGCTLAKILPADWADYIPSNGIYIPALALDQQEKALVTDGSNLGSVSFRVPTDATRLTFYEPLISGDSGNPGSLIIDGELVVLTVWTYGGPGSGASVTTNKAAIEAAMVSLGGVYTTLTEIDLSGFNTY